MNGIALTREATRTHRDLPITRLPAEWTERAACLDLVELFDVAFESPGRWAGKRAKAICQGDCPVRELCLEMAMENERGRQGYRYGVFGGLSPKERAKLARERGEV